MSIDPRFVRDRGDELFNGTSLRARGTIRTSAVDGTSPVSDVSVMSSIDSENHRLRTRRPVEATAMPTKNNESVPGSGTLPVHRIVL